MRIASIDIGTNTVLLLIADVDDAGTISVVHEEQRIPRLGKNVDEHRTIRQTAFDQILQILNDFKDQSQRLHADRIIACGTSFLRDASNREQFLSHIKQHTGISVEVLSGEDEALWTYRGALSGLTISEKHCAVIDIGGGSTELSYGRSEMIVGIRDFARHSLQLGSVRLTERYFQHLPPTPEELKAASRYIGKEIEKIHDSDFHRYELVGVAGTLTTLACFDLGLENFDRQKISGYRLSFDVVGTWLDRLTHLTANDIRELSHCAKGREDIITAGVLILYEMMDAFAFPSVTVSERGLRFGLALREWEKIKNR
ncbi:MAG TPA: Ppx/GppA phosphatase family protein [Bacteroidota bacterium]|nr:Ppx/GppA phosphatase family protein [Bacteroidota bacterium]